MNLITLLGLFVVTGAATTIGSLPVIFHHDIRASHWHWWESFGSGVMVSASLFSLFLPALEILDLERSHIGPFILGLFFGVLFIFLMAFLIQKFTQNITRQRAILFVFVMGLHNIPEGLSVGVDVAALGWRASLPLTIAIFIQNLPEGLVSAMSFLLAGFSLKKSLLANGVTAVIEFISSFLGFSMVTDFDFNLVFLLSFAGASMMSVVLREIYQKYRYGELNNLSWSGLGLGFLLVAILDLFL